MNATGVDIGNFETITISGQKYEDVNGNGGRDAGEPGIAGWTILLDAGADGTVDDMRTTASDGSYDFADLGPGVYRVREEQRPGWVQMTGDPRGSADLSCSRPSAVD